MWNDGHEEGNEGVNLGYGCMGLEKGMCTNEVSKKPNRYISTL